MRRHSFCTEPSIFNLQLQFVYITVTVEWHECHRITTFSQLIVRRHSWANHPDFLPTIFLFRSVYNWKL